LQQYKAIHINSNLQIPHYDYEEFGVQGVGVNRTPIVNMDQYIDHSLDEELHYECLKGLALNEDSLQIGGSFIGDTTPFEEFERTGQGWTSILNSIDRNSKHYKNILELADKKNPLYTISKYMYYGMGAIMPWAFTLYLKDNNFLDKTGGGQWSKASNDFPLLKEYIKTLPFKEVGRVLLFCTYPGAGIVTHRDWILEDHKDHNINLFFDGGPRPSFVWDEIQSKKIYLDDTAKSYFFNNRDYHGVDSEPNFRYTVRVDGTFTDDMCKQLGLENGYTWKREYNK